MKHLFVYIEYIIYICVGFKYMIMQTIEQRQKIAKDVAGLLGNGKLNWMGCYSHEFKRSCFSIFFNSRAKAEKAAIKLSDLNPKILKTPSFVNSYFKYSLFILD